MSETIKAIEPYEHNERWNREAGFKITTSLQEVLLVIDADSSCCEQWGYFLTEDDTSKFIGAELRGVSVTDTNRSKKRIERISYNERYDFDDPNIVDLDSGDVLFVDIETDRGVLQFVAYNAHNGYYGHQARVVSNQLNHEAIL
jgi:hypothetical protein